MNADSEYRIRFYPNPTFHNQKPSNICQKWSKSRIGTSIHWIFLSGQYFFTNIFIPFYSAWKVLSNHMKTNLVGNFNSESWYTISAGYTGHEDMGKSNMLYVKWYRWVVFLDVFISFCSTFKCCQTIWNSIWLMLD